MNQQLNPLGRYCIYLRKSRADAEAELRGEEETLARHEKILLDLAKKLKIHIGAIYREVVSGESIQNRPVMQQVLQEVNQSMWDGVLVVEVERLARGDTSDQGTVAKAFKYSNTLIITPVKIYDPNDEFDEEYFEFGLFMSRREYKTINRRLQNGRYTSMGEGKFVGNKTPYGYDRVKILHDKGFTLAFNEDEHPWAVKIFEWFNGVNCKPLGTARIANKLNNLGIPSRTGSGWTPATIRGILRNPVYAGWIWWGHRKVERTLDSNGKVSKTRPINHDYALYKGLHPATISQELFDATQKLVLEKSTPQHTLGRISNPLQGIVFCSECGRHMIIRPYKDKPAGLLCPFKGCPTVSSQLDVVEESLLNYMRDWLDNYKMNQDISITHDNIELLSDSIDQKQSELDALRQQHEKQYEFLESGVYSTEVFLKRSGSIQDKINDVSDTIEYLYSQIDAENALNESQNNFIPKCEYLLDSYEKLDIREKNGLWRELIEKVVYIKKEKNKKWQRNLPTFELHVYPRIPSRMNK